MKLLSWNIQWGRGMDGQVDLARIIRTIRKIGEFDVICLQEVAVNFPGLPGSRDENQVDELSAQLPGYTAIYGAATDVPDSFGGRSQFGNAIFTRLPVGQIWRHLLPWQAELTTPSMQRVLESKFKIVDTCGVHNLHGMPGLLGGISAFLVVPGIAIGQFNGIMITLIIAIVGGLIAGAIIKATGTTREPYEDSVEFTHLAGPETEKLPEQLQTRVEALEIQSSAPKPHAPMESPETKALIARLELRVMTLESNIAATQNRETGEKPESIA